MANIDILLQGWVNGDDHDSAINKLLKEDFDNYLLNIAFARSGGVKKISEKMSLVKDKVKVFLGIRNGITSIQALMEFMKIGIHPYVVDTASNSRIFHPKIYAGYSEKHAHALLGSANLTTGGLCQNIETSSYVILDREDESDEKYLVKLIEIYRDLPSRYPDHVFQVKSLRQTVILLQDGRLEDERLTKISSTHSVFGKTKRDKLAPIDSIIKSSSKKRQTTKSKVAKSIKKRTSAKTAVFVWESKPLTERSLNIPAGTNTQLTGDINLGQGLMVGLDFQHYFRDEIFNKLRWTTRAGQGAHLERGIIKVEVVVKQLSYGIYDLEVTHDPRTNSISYDQKNVMTKIKWGNARTLIAKPDLLGRTLTLYQKDEENFVIVID